MGMTAKLYAVDLQLSGTRLQDEQESKDSKDSKEVVQRLQDRIKQHVPKSIRYGTSFPKRDLPIRKCKYSTKATTQIQSLTHDSAIGLHLLRNPTCA